MKVLIINGPNLNLLGTREKEVYGNSSFEAYFDELKLAFPKLDLQYFQSNVEGEIVNALHNSRESVGAVLLNAGGYTHTSIAIRDAVAGIDVPVIEIHISNILAREEFRHTSLIGGVCQGSIGGFGLNSYRLGLESLLH